MKFTNEAVASTATIHSQGSSSEAGRRDAGRAGRELLRDVALDCIALDGRARLIVDASLKLVWASPATLTVLACDPAISIVGDRIADGPGRGAIDALCASAGTGRAETTLGFSKGDGNYLLHAYGLGSGSTYFCIEIQVDCNDARPRFADFGRVFRFTRTEVEIVHLMLDGYNVIDIARRRLVSVETVRSHIRGIYEKMRVTSREQFFSRICRFKVV